MKSYPQEAWFLFFMHLSRYIDSRISHSGKHSTQVAFWVESTARRLKIDEPEIQALFWAALLHDIGKIGVPDRILSKAGPLTPNEWDLMRMHPTIGANIVRTLKYIAHIAPAIHHHQEKYDGSGYPDGLCGDQIPLGARILAVADAYHAMTEDRVYRSARTRSDAVEELRSLEGRQFDPVVVDAFLQVVSEQPVQ